MLRIEKITGRDNPRLVHARKVRDGRVSSQIFVEGKRLAVEAIRSRLTVDLAIFSESFSERAEFLIESVGEIIEVPERLFPSIAATKSSPGVVLIARRPRYSHETFGAAALAAKLPIVPFLYRINNPSNLGAVMRTVEAVGAAGIILSAASTDAYSPKTLRAAMGAAFRLKVWENACFDAVMEWSRANGLASIATASRGGVAYTEVDWHGPKLLIFGSEAHGLEREALTSADRRITIPLEDGVESLNLAVSAAVVLFEARRQVASATD